MVDLSENGVKISHYPKVEIKNRKKFVSKNEKNKLLLKSIIFDLASIETNLFLRVFESFFSSISKNGKRSFQKKRKKVSLKIKYFRFGVN